MVGDNHRPVCPLCGEQIPPSNTICMACVYRSPVPVENVPRNMDARTKRRWIAVISWGTISLTTVVTFFAMGVLFELVPSEPQWLAMTVMIFGITLVTVPPTIFLMWLNGFELPWARKNEKYLPT